MYTKYDTPHTPRPPSSHDSSPDLTWPGSFRASSCTTTARAGGVKGRQGPEKQTGCIMDGCDWLKAGGAPCRCCVVWVQFLLFLLLLRVLAYSYVLDSWLGVVFLSGVEGHRYDSSLYFFWVSFACDGDGWWWWHLSSFLQVVGWHLSFLLITRFDIYDYWCGICHFLHNALQTWCVLLLIILR